MMPSVPLLPPCRRLAPMLLAILVLAGMVPARAAGLTQLPGLIREEISVTITPPGSGPVTLEGQITRPDKPGRWPLVLINHGTPRLAEDLPRQTPTQYAGIAVEFARHGYVAAVVMRRGHGLSGGPPARNGPCDNRNYLGAGTDSADDVLAILERLRQQPWVDPEHALLVGQSTGGFAVMAAGARNPRFVQAIVNFAGGRGSQGPDDVCQPDRLVAAMAEYGRHGRIPSLWIYSENDHFFGPKLARQMVDAYRAGGGAAEFFAAPAVGQDGHEFFRAAIDRWQAPVEHFLAANGLPATVTIPPEPIRLAPASQMSPNTREAFAKYLASEGFEKAFAFSPSHGYGFATGARTQADAEERALEYCRQRNSDCRIYAIGNNPAGAPAH